MLYVILSMFAGILFGYFFRKKDKLIRVLDKLSSIAIYFLLFALGLTVGVNQQIIRNIANLGLKAFFISMSAIAGSLIVGFVVYLLFFKGKSSENSDR